MTSFFANHSLQKRAIKIALIVGTVLALINYSDKLLAGSMAPSDWLKMLATYLVPYVVASYSAYSALKNNQGPR